MNTLPIFDANVDDPTPGSLAVYSYKKSDLPKVEGYTPVKNGIRWHLRRLVRYPNKWGDYAVLPVYLLDQEAVRRFIA